MSGSAKWDGPAKELTTKIRLIVGPVNSAGQGTAWARAVDQYVDDASAHSCSFRRDPQRYESDYLISAETYKTDWDFRAEFSRYLIPRFTHALLEGDAPLFARVGQRDVAEDIALLRERGVQVALIAHGSDVRLPSHHVEIEPWSPFRSMDPDVYKRMEAFAKRSVRIFNAYPGPVFISTPDLIEFVPAATWCPVIVDPERWASAQGVFERNIPIVAHAPSSSDMKGSDLIDPLLERLHADGVIEYRRVQDIEPKEMPAIYGDADIVVDQLALGSYGVAACEAMAAGRIVLGHVSEQVRSAAQEAAGLDLPILEVTPDSIVERIRELLADRESARDTAARGPEFVRTLHDGRRSASVLADFLRNGDRAPAHWLPGVVGQRVVMMAGNDIIVDSRVMKYAQTAAQWGLDVIAIGIAGKYFRGVEMFDGVSVRCPVVPRRYNVKRRGAWQALTPWYNEEADRKRDVAGLAYDRRELGADRARIKRDMLREPLTKPPGRLAPWRTKLGFALRRRHLGVRQALIRARGSRLTVSRRWTARLSASENHGVGRRRQLAMWFYRYSGTAKWQRVLPEIVDRENALGPMLDRLNADVIHVHDVFMIGVAARAAQRAALRGRSVKIIYDAHEYIPGVPVIKPRLIAAYSDLERAFINDMDRIITVSEPLAEWLKRDHGLLQRPDVVMNAPVGTPDDARVVGIRDVLSLDAEVPLLVYAGGVNRARGVATAVDALPVLEGVHLVLVARVTSIVNELTDRAKALGVADRFHVVPFVDPELVPLYLKSATIGLSPLLRAPNHDIAITNKFCEYIAAGLPIVSSDTPAQAELINNLDLGAVHRAGDVKDFARAVREVLGDHPRLVKRIREDESLPHRFSWSAQAKVIRDVYESVLGDFCLLYTSDAADE